jgi:hypothetical protein
MQMYAILARIHARNQPVAGMLIYALCFSVLLLTSCRKASVPASSQPQSATTSQAAMAALSSSDAQSCRLFVQSFYDWYWNHIADSAGQPGFDPRKLPSVETVLRQKPFVLSPELIRLLGHEEREMERTNEIGNLDFDPILASQDPRGKYLVSNVTASASRCTAIVQNGDLASVELSKFGSSWTITNFRYVYIDSLPDGRTKESTDDLVGLLKRSPFK